MLHSWISLMAITDTWGHAPPGPQPVSHYHKKRQKRSYLHDWLAKDETAYPKQPENMWHQTQALEFGVNWPLVQLSVLKTNKRKHELQNRLLKDLTTVMTRRKWIKYLQQNTDKNSISLKYQNILYINFEKDNQSNWKLSKGHEKSLHKRNKEYIKSI